MGVITNAPPANNPQAAAAASGKSGPPAIVNPFVRAAKEHTEPFHDLATQLVAATSIQRGPFDVSTFGYARYLLLKVTASGGAGGAAVVAEDGPWSVLQDVQLLDVTGAPLVGPVSGYDLYLINKYGVYNGQPMDPVNNPAHSAVDANGNFTFMLRIPIEIAARDALGALPNMNSSQNYKLQYTIAAPLTVYGVVPAGAQPSVRVQAWLEAWSQPPGADPFGVANETQPPAVGTTQYWSKTVVNVAAGEQRIELPRIGHLIRNLVFILRTAAGARSTANFPDPLRAEWDGKIHFNAGRDVLRMYMRERFGFAPDTGVIVFDYTHDGEGSPGNEMRHLYLPTSTATRYEIVGNFGAAGSLTILTNDVAPQMETPGQVRGGGS